MVNKVPKGSVYYCVICAHRPDLGAVVLHHCASLLGGRIPKTAARVVPGGRIDRAATMQSCIRCSHRNVVRLGASFALIRRDVFHGY